MLQLVFSDAQFWSEFLPLTFTKPVAELRCGMLSFAERWKMLLGLEVATYITEDYLQPKYQSPEKEESLFLVPNFLPTPSVLEQIKTLKLGEALVYENELLAVRLDMGNFSLNQIEKMTDIEEPLLFFRKHTDLFTFNKEAIDFDFNLLTKGKKSQSLSSTNCLLGNAENLFIEEGTVVECSTLNCKDGKIYIGKNAEIMEGCHLRGSVAVGEYSVLKLGAKIYGATSIGKHCTIGGEVKNSVVMNFSNKGHEGYLGNSVIGEWCNLGADTNSSNLKNNYANVKLWNYSQEKFVDTGLQFCGLIMGDHSKSAINTQFNTGTVVGVAANIFKTGFPPNLVKSFSWGGMNGDEKYRLDKVFEVMERVMSRKNIALTDADRGIITHLY